MFALKTFNFRHYKCSTMSWKTVKRLRLYGIKGRQKWRFCCSHPIHHVLPYPCSFSYVSVPTTNTQCSVFLSLILCVHVICCSQFHNVLLWGLRLQSSDNQRNNNDNNKIEMMVFDYVRNLGDQEHPQVVLRTEFVAALCLCLIIAHLLEANRWVTESITAILTITSLSLSLSLSQVELLYGWPFR